MPELHIQREHRLGLQAARAAAARWAQEAARDWGMDCRTVTGPAGDEIHFERAGVKGCLVVRARRLDLQVQLGFLLGAYAGRIEQQIRQSLDQLLGPA